MTETKKTEKKVAPKKVYKYRVVVNPARVDMLRKKGWEVCTGAKGAPVMSKAFRNGLGCQQMRREIT